VGNIPVALVTGSNGKTTTVRLLAACARRHGWQTAFSCTDGVFIGSEPVATGDYSGPSGARLALRDARTQAAILETARGGILRRGIAVSGADVAVVTNVSSDHFGEYGIDDLDALADVKLTVAAVVEPQGMLVLNADDELLRAKASGLARRFGRVPETGWFSLDADAAALREHRAHGGSTCGVRDGSLRLSHRGADHDLGRIRKMPLTADATAAYNVANLAAAALAAVALRIPPVDIRDVLEQFGARPDDNVGRLMRYEVGGVRIILDYAHNPAGLHGLLRVAEHLRAGQGRLALLLGHAGNRQDAELATLAEVAAEYRPGLIVLKENAEHLRGREPGEVPRILRAALLRSGMSSAALPVCMNELEAARYALEWAQPSDVLVFPIHSPDARSAVLALIEARQRQLRHPPGAR